MAMRGFEIQRLGFVILGSRAYCEKSKPERHPRHIRALCALRRAERAKAGQS